MVGIRIEARRAADALFLLHRQPRHVERADERKLAAKIRPGLLLVPLPRRAVRGAELGRAAAERADLQIRPRAAGMAAANARSEPRRPLDVRLLSQTGLAGSHGRPGI